MAFSWKRFPNSLAISKGQTNVMFSQERLGCFGYSSVLLLGWIDNVISSFFFFLSFDGLSISKKKKEKSNWTNMIYEQINMLLILIIRPSFPWEIQPYNRSVQMNWLISTGPSRTHVHVVLNIQPTEKCSFALPSHFHSRRAVSMHAIKG